MAAAARGGVGWTAAASCCESCSTPCPQLPPPLYLPPLAPSLSAPTPAPIYHTQASQLTTPTKPTLTHPTCAHASNPTHTATFWELEREGGGKVLVVTLGKKRIGHESWQYLLEQDRPDLTVTHRVSGGGWMDGWGCMGGWVVGGWVAGWWLDGWMGGWVGGWWVRGAMCVFGGGGQGVPVWNIGALESRSNRSNQSPVKADSSHTQPNPTHAPINATAVLPRRAVRIAQRAPRGWALREPRTPHDRELQGALHRGEGQGGSRRAAVVQGGAVAQVGGGVGFGWLRVCGEGSWGLGDVPDQLALAHPTPTTCPKTTIFTLNPNPNPTLNPNPNPNPYTPYRRQGDTGVHGSGGRHHTGQRDGRGVNLRRVI